MKIACIEDNNEDLFLIKTALEKIIPTLDIYSYHYLHDFLKAGDDHDLVITDLALPDGYGPKIVKKIREVTDKPIIIFSGVGGEKISNEIRDGFYQSGANLFLTKNENGYELLARSLNQFT